MKFWWAHPPTPSAVTQPEEHASAVKLRLIGRKFAIEKKFKKDIDLMPSKSPLPTITATYGQRRGKRSWHSTGQQQAGDSSQNEENWRRITSVKKSLMR
jgi:hypothetical protein